MSNEIVPSPCCICDTEAQFYNQVDSNNYCEVCAENEVNTGIMLPEDFENL